MTKIIDWEAVERDYRAGILTLRAMAEKHGGSHVAIAKRAKKEGWPRDLTAKIRAKVTEKVNSEAVNKQETAGAAVTERQVVEANATAVAAALIGHKRQIERAQGVASKLLAELELHTDDPELLLRLADAMFDPESEDVNKLRADARAAIRKAMGLPGRSTVLKSLSESLKTLIALERQAYRVDETPEEGARSAPSQEVAEGVGEALAVAVARITAASVPAE